ncbi:hypothetical protein Tco_1041170, partial [Tanacetum coccineum]
ETCSCTALEYRLYYCKVGMPIRLGLTELKTNDDVQEFMRLRYISKWVIDLYTEHFDYDVLDFIDASQIENVSETMMSITLVMNKKNLISNRGKFRGYIDEPIENGMDDTIKDPFASHIDPEHKVKSGVVYPKHDPTLPCNEMEPILGMRNDWKCLLVHCGRDVGDEDSIKELSCKVVEGCSKSVMGGFKGGEGTSKGGEGTSKGGEGTSKVGKGTSRAGRGETNGSSKWTKKKILEIRKKPVYSFRGELLTAMGKDVNNQIYPTAWAVVKVENHETRGWFLS